MLVVRHGETEWSRAGRHTGRTDVPLSPEGEAQARGLAGVVSRWHPRLVLTSPLLRARRTAELAGLSPQVDPDLAEWDYGVYEGRTTAEIRAGDPGWSVWASPPGLAESLGDVADRAGRVLARCGPVLAAGDDVVLVAHAHLLRVLTATWLGLPPRGGSSLVLGPGGTGVLGHERETPVLLRWNA
jgi:probable phosphoglycerate mutase